MGYYMDDRRTGRTTALIRELIKYGRPSIFVVMNYAHLRMVADQIVETANRMGIPILRRPALDTLPLENGAEIRVVPVEDFRRKTMGVRCRIEFDHAAFDQTLYWPAREMLDYANVVNATIDAEEEPA